MPAQVTVGCLPGITIEMRYDSRRLRTTFSSLMSGAVILSVSEAEAPAVSAESTALADELRNHYGSRVTLFNMNPPIQAAFNNLLNAVARHRLQTT